MNPIDSAISPVMSSGPRTRGDEPIRIERNGDQPALVPAHAGMNRGNVALYGFFHPWSPHTRG